jgi:L-ascorbate metabolism protein UlaG (beta-lactamase superfamily)
LAITVKWLGHSGTQIKVDGKNIYVDLEKSCKPTDKADIILVTHSHYDHCDPDKIKEVRRPDTVVIAPADCVSKIGGKVQSLKPGAETTIGGIRVRAVEAYNVKRFRAPGQPFHPKGLGVGYLITAQGKTIYHAGDTDFIPEMKQLGGPIDVALLPAGGTYTMENDDAADAAIAITPKAAIAIHTWGKPADVFQRKVQAGSKTKVIMLREGEEYRVP